MALPDPKKTEQKLRIANDLFKMAMETKKFRLRAKHPEWSEQELVKQAYALVEKGCK